jgi:hypothetical protein
MVALLETEGLFSIAISNKMYAIGNKYASMLADAAKIQNLVIIKKHLVIILIHSLTNK